MGDRSGAHRGLVGIPRERDLFEWENNIEMNLQEVG